MKWALALPILACAPACSGDGAAAGRNEAGRREGSQRWSSRDCRDWGQETVLHADGIYEEGGGRGRWFVRGAVLHVQIVEPPTVAFMTMYPQFMAADEDGQLPFVGPDEVEAKSGDLATRFRRCR